MTLRRIRRIAAVFAAVLLFLMLAVVSFGLCRYFFGFSEETTGLGEIVSSVASETTTFGVTLGAAEKPVKEAMTCLPEETISAAEVVIALDAGHGFGDPGCESEYLSGTESEAVLEITMLLKEKLEALGATVYLTHDGLSYPTAAELKELLQEYGVDYQEDRVLEDEYYSPYERTIYASCLHNMMTLDLFLSLHINSLPESPEVSQCELYYCRENPAATQLSKLTEALCDSLPRETKTEASGYEEAFIITKYAQCPSLLVEMGYATNPQDAQNLNSQTWRGKFCDILATEIMAWARNNFGK